MSFIPLLSHGCLVSRSTDFITFLNVISYIYISDGFTNYYTIFTTSDLTHDRRAVSAVIYNQACQNSGHLYIIRSSDQVHIVRKMNA